MLLLVRGGVLAGIGREVMVVPVFWGGRVDSARASLTEGGADQRDMGRPSCFRSAALPGQGLWTTSLHPRSWFQRPSYWTATQIHTS